MHLLLSTVIVVLALLDMVIGIGFFVNPSTAAGDFGLLPKGPQGTAALRADFTAFFLLAAVFMGAGAWKRRADWLVPPLFLFAVAFTGRAVDAIVNGPWEGFWLPMAVEMAHIVILGLAIRFWPGAPGRAPQAG